MSEKERSLSEFQASDVAVAVVSGVDHNLVYANDLFLEGFKVEVGGKLGGNAAPAIPLIDQARHDRARHLVRHLQVGGDEATLWDCEVVPLHESGGQVPVLVFARRSKELEDLRQQLAEKDTLLDLIMEYVPWGITVSDNDRVINWVSDHGCDLLSLRREDLLGMSIEDLLLTRRFYRDGSSAVPEALPLARTLTSGEVILGEEWQVADGAGRKRKDLLCNAAPMRGTDSSVIGGITTFGDISALKGMMQRLRDTLEEKEVLLRELHHRVKNNLQVVVSLALMERIQNPHAADVCDRLIARLDAVAKVHETLGLADDVSRVNFVSYIRKLAAELSDVYHANHIAIDVTGAEDLPLDVATPLGLIVNELLTNSIKHGFAGRQAGAIGIVLRAQGDDFELKLSDNGSGRIEHPTGMKTSLGTRLVEDLVRQLNGRIEINAVPGTGSTWRIVFPRSPIARAARPA